ETNFNVHTFGLNAQAVLDFGQYARLTTGLDVYHDIVHSRSVDIRRDDGAKLNHDRRNAFPDWSRYTSLGIYAQHETELLDELLLLRDGARYSASFANARGSKFSDDLDDLSDTHSVLTGAFVMAVRPMDALSVTMSLAKGFRAPNLDDLAA